MKKLLLIFIVIPLFTTAQTDTTAFPKDADGNFVFTEVIKNDSSTADQLYNRAKFFVANEYKSSKEVTQLNDDATKTILLKPVININIKTFIRNGNIGYTSYQLTIECKEGRYRYTASGLVFHYIWRSDTGTYNLELPNSKVRYITKSEWQQIRQQSYDEINGIVNHLKTALQKNNSDF